MLISGRLNRREGDRRVREIVPLPRPVEYLVCGGVLLCQRDSRGLSGGLSGAFHWRINGCVSFVLHVGLVADGAVRRAGLWWDRFEPERRQGIQRPLGCSAVAGVRICDGRVERLDNVIDDGGDVWALAGCCTALDGAGYRVAERGELYRARCQCCGIGGCVRLRGAAPAGEKVVERERKDSASDAVVAQRVVDSLAAHCCVVLAVVHCPSSVSSSLPSSPSAD